ncbi:MAG: helix-turn-helix domain-containing protein, partial [Candidatus Thorarchaeota archaeon]
MHIIRIEMNLLAESVTSEVSSRATTILRELGYGAHETQVIITLSQVDSSTVADLSAVTKIHHANLYSVLSSLEGKGVVVGSEKRPRIFQLAPLKHLKEHLSTKVDQLMKDLKQLQRERKSVGVVPALIYTVRGHSDVEAKMLSMLGKAKE